MKKFLIPLGSLVWVPGQLCLLLLCASVILICIIAMAPAPKGREEVGGLAHSEVSWACILLTGGGRAWLQDAVPHGLRGCITSFLCLPTMADPLLASQAHGRVSIHTFGPPVKEGKTEARLGCWLLSCHMLCIPRVRLLAACSLWPAGLTLTQQHWRHVVGP